jgi:hypothetical protein
MDGATEIAQLRAENARLATELRVVHMTFDAIGVEVGDTAGRCGYLRGSVLGFRLMGMRWGMGGVGAVAAVAAQPISATEASPARPVEVPPVQLAAMTLEQLAVALPAMVPASPAQPVASSPASPPPASPISATEASPAQPVETEPPLDWDAPPAAAAESATSDASPATSPDPAHDPSWSDDLTRRTFFAALTEAGIGEPYEIVAAFCEAHGIKRPSRMTVDERATFLGLAGKKVQKDRLIEWCSIHGAEVAAELKAKKAAAAAERKAKRAAALRAGQAQ